MDTKQTITLYGRIAQPETKRGKGNIATPPPMALPAPPLQRETRELAPAAAITRLTAFTPSPSLV